MNDTNAGATESAQNALAPANDVAIAVEADPTISYLHVQNNVPVVRSIQLTNQSDRALTTVEVLVSCDPAFVEPQKLVFERLEPGETRRIAPLDLQPSHSYLANLSESEKARIVVEARTDGASAGSASRPIEVLAYDQWAGTRALPELLAGFCTPNAPAVDRILATAAEQLQARQATLNGYQSKNREAVWAQISAVYNAIASMNLQYSDPPASFGKDGQKIRTPDRMKSGGVGTCLDLAMLAASCLEQAGLNPIVLFQEGHAWVGCWLLKTQFPVATVEDVQAVRKRVDSGELLVFEATGLAQTSRPSLRVMHERGIAHLKDEAKFRFVIDIARAREQRILPLPAREAAAVQSERAAAVVPVIEESPALPRLDPTVLPETALENPENETPAGRLSRWKSRLLDMTLRNRMLNFKPSQSNLRLLVPDPAHLEDALADGKEFKVRAMPKVMEGADPRSAEVHVQRVGRQATEEIARDAMAKHELLAMLEDGDLDGRLLTVHKTARDSLEEGGSNTLFLTLGFLEWREAEKAEVKHRAPLVLVPVSMTRQSVHGGFRIKRHDDETIINPTLRQYLKEEFKISIPALENPPTDEKGVDVAAIWQAVRLGINHITGWEVSTEVYLANLSFAKYLMWVDLQTRTEQLKQSRVVRHLIDHAGQTFPREDARDVDDLRLDDTHKPQDILAPLIADSSQLRVVALAAEGKDLVCEGPPGTGKSQSITNLIANLIAQDKTVLFVSEKMAALEVVQRRLKQIGLGPFCLELHSAKASKGEVVKQLGEALQTAGRKSVRDWEREADRLGVMRAELNSFVDVLHREHKNGCNVYDATGIAVENRQWKAADLPWPTCDEHDRNALDALRDLTRKMSVLAREIGELKGHALQKIGRTEWSPAYQDDLYRRSAALMAATDALENASREAFTPFKLSATGPSLQELAAFDLLAGVLIAAPGVPSGFAARAHDSQVRGRVATMKAHGALRQEIWGGFGNRYSSDLAKQGGADLARQWSDAKVTWWPKKWFAQRALAKQLAALRVGGEQPQAAEIEEVLPALVRLNEQDKLLAGYAPEAQLLDIASTDTVDWATIDRHRAWGESLSKAIAAVAGGDIDRAVALQQRITPLIGEHRNMLAPDGAIGGHLLVFREAHTVFLAKLDELEKAAHVRVPLAGASQAQGALSAIRATLQGWEGARRQLRTWCIWSGLRADAVTKGLKTIVEAVEGGTVSLDVLPTFFEYSYAVWFIARVMDRESQLCRFTGMDHERKIQEFKAADESFQRLTQDYIVAKLCSRMPSGGVPTGPDSEMGMLRREIQRQRGHMPLRRLVQTLPTLLPKLKPCLLMSPLSVAQYLPPGTAPFDTIVFDEASQIPVWDAVGAIARGKQVIVVGDSKQLPPTSFFNRAEGDDQPADVEEVQDLESILDELASTGLQSLRLQWHYRSRSEGLIAFSNQQYYDGSLITFPSPVTDDRAVQWRAVSGAYDRGGSKTNRAEAEAIVEEVVHHFRDETRRHKTVGIVTFNIPQRDLIETLLEARRRSDLELDRRMAEHKAEDVFIKNLESVQGDERDIIMFSVTYGPDAAGKVTNNFGPLNLEGGHRRLNVAITRARESVLLFSALRPEMINPATVRARGVMDLKLYLEYAQRGPKALVEASILTGRAEESPFERAVASALRNKGWTVHPQVGVSSYRIDLGIVDPKAPGRYLLGIEADGRTYHSAASARDRDRLRQHVLEGLGWKIHRIWSTDWYTNHDRELEKIVARLDELVALPAAGEGIPDPVPAVLAPAEPRYASAIVEEVHQDAQMPVYEPCSLEIKGLPLEFRDDVLDALRQRLECVVNAEGPIRDGVLYRKVANAAGWERVGSRIEQQLKSLASMRFDKVHDNQGTFYFPKHTSPNGWTGFRVAGAQPESRRNAQDVAILELANLMTYLLQHGGASTVPGISKDVGKLIGMQRVTADAEARIREAVEHLAKAGRIRLDGESIVLLQ